ncbi:MAG: hypothetical protein AAB091_01785 [Elusimicrobiota bacterium]
MKIKLRDCEIMTAGLATLIFLAAIHAGWASSRGPGNTAGSPAHQSQGDPVGSLQAVFDGQRPVVSLIQTFQAGANAGNGILQGFSDVNFSVDIPSRHPDVQRHLDRAQAHESRAWGLMGGTLASMAVAGAAMGVMAWGAGLSAGALAFLGAVAWAGIAAAIVMGIIAIYSHAASRDARAEAWHAEQAMAPPSAPKPPEQSHEEWMESVGVGPSS